MSSTPRSRALRRLRLLPILVAMAHVALLAVLAVPAAAFVNSTPDQAVETNGEIDAVLASGNRVFIGGNFTRAGASVGGGTDLAQSTGAPSYAFAKPNSTVSAIASDGAGGWFIAGSFTRVGTVARNRIAHLLADGSVDPAFDPNVGANVNALVRSGTTLYAAGQFTTVNGSTTRNRIAAFDTTTGIATSFDPSVNGMQVMSLALSGTTLYAGGGFVSVGNPAVTRNRLAAFDTTTSQPTSFDPNLSQNVAAIAISGTTLYAAGGFTTVNNGTVPRNRIAAFDTTTTGAALPFDPNVNGSASALAVSGGTVYAGGSFTLVNGSAPGVTRNRIAAFDGTTGTVLAGFDPNASGTVNALVLAGGTLYAGGAFAVLNGTAGRNNIAALNPADGTVLGGFDPNLDGTVNALAVAGSRVYAGGTFSFAGTGTIRNRLAAITSDGTLDPDFNPNIPTTNGFVRALATSGSTVYAGGDFTTVNGTIPRNRLAAFDATTGAVVAGFDPNIPATVRALALSGSKLYAGGDFTTVNGATTRNRLAAFDTATGVADATFDPNLSSLVNVLLRSGGKLYAGGGFQTVNGATTRNRLAAFDATSGIVDATFNPNVGANVTALALGGATLYAGGSFTTVNGSTARNRLAAVDATTGAVVAGFNPDANASINALVVSGSIVYAGGDFTTINGATVRNRLAALNTATGVADPGFNPNMGSQVFGLALSGTRLHAVGNYITVGPNTVQRHARFSEPAPSVTTGPANAVTETTATLGGTVNPNGLATTYVFEYGTSLAFGAITPAEDAAAGASPAPVSASLTGLAAHTTYYVRLVASSAAGTSVGSVVSFSTTGAAQAPVAITQAATALSTSGATLHGQVNPNGQATAFTFEYGTTTSFGAIATVVALDDAIALEPVSAVLTGLAPDTHYSYRVVATNATGTSTGAVMSFDTGPGGAPLVTTGTASAITASGATLAATIDPHGARTTFTFEYGTTTAFGSLSAIDVAGATNGSRPVSLPLTGLLPGTTYRYRIVATNANGTTVGGVASFTTPTSLMRRVALSRSGFEPAPSGP